mgnify:CR=1 FL=1
MRILIIGSNGRIGSEIKKQFQEYEILTPPRSVYHAWHSEKKISEIEKYFETNKNINGIFICSGIMNSSKDPSEINKVNYLLPKNIIKSVKSKYTKIVLFGTVMELIAAGSTEYVKSKQRLQDFLNQECKHKKILSLKIHTVYGGLPPNNYMFLGQILESIKSLKNFKMSSGNQLREYHHVEDLVYAIKHLYKKDVYGIVDISTGQSIRLKDLATSIFTYFGKHNLLKLGAIKDNNLENYSYTLPRHSLTKNLKFRDAKNGIIEYLKENLDSF